MELFMCFFSSHTHTLQMFVSLSHLHPELNYQIIKINSRQSFNLKTALAEFLRKPQEAMRFCIKSCVLCILM